MPRRRRGTAQAAAEAPTDAGPAVETLPCNSKVQKECSPNSGDTAWMLTSMAIVLMMTVPGLALFYGGMVRKKNVGDTVMTSFAITCLISILWLFFTYSLAFREGGDVFGYDMGWFIGGFDRAGLQGIMSDIANNKGNPNSLAPTIPETVYSMFQLTFAIITAALIFGSTAERMKFSAMLWFTGLWAVFVYSPIAHWVWGPDGMFNSSNPHSFINVLDFAGGTVVHVNSGTAGLMCALMLGKRKDTGPAHNMVLTLIGASLLWVGWFGFNAGSAVTAGLQAGMAMLVTHTATATAGFTWMMHRVVPEGQADRHRHLLGRGGGSGRHHAGVGLRRSDGLVLDRRRGRHHLLLGLHRPQAHVRLRRRPRHLRGARGRRRRRRDCSPACSRSTNTAAPPGCSRAMRCRSSTRRSASARCSSTTWS